MKTIISPIILLFALFIPSANAATSTTFSTKPPGLLQNNAPPAVMLTMPKDHQLFFKAYSDFEDLNGDSKPETTYSPTFAYVGYFDYKLCYEYDDSKNWFKPVQAAKFVVAQGYLCNVDSDDALDTSKKLWSGNFLNWGTMTKIDILRKALYGGKRAGTQPSATDGVDGVLLERSHIPGDSHSFAKYYGGADLRKITPYDATVSTPDCIGKNTTSCEAVKKGITLCNTTLISPTESVLSQNTTNPPIIRVALGNFSLWSASERVQCKFHNSGEFAGIDWGGVANSASTINGFNSLMTSIFGNANKEGTGVFYFFHDSPSVNTDSNYEYIYEPAYGSGKSQKINDFQARVIACNSIPTGGSENCIKYGTKSKPTGILQDKTFASYQWGLMSGSFKSNMEGGLLRKNISPLDTEIDSNGDFLAPANGGLIAFLDNLRIVNWGYITGAPGSGDAQNDSKSSYVGWGGNNCGQPSGSPHYGRVGKFSNGQCVSWGNPLSEILMEGYRYFAGYTTPMVSAPDDTSFFANTTAKKAMGSQSWSQNPLAAANTSGGLKKCSPLHLMAINGSSVSYDGDMTFPQNPVPNYVTNTTFIGTNEFAQANFTKYFVGEAQGTGTPVCKPVDKGSLDLANIRGTCPDAPALGGSYLMAGMAYEANLNRDFNLNYGKGVKTSGISLNMGTAKIEINTRGGNVLLLPACRNKDKDSAGNFMGSCALVDFKFLSRDENNGKILVIWEDAQQGSDFDQDVTQLIDYTVTGSQVTITTKVLSISTKSNVELGYTISGIQEVASATPPISEGYQTGVLEISQEAPLAGKGENTRSFMASNNPAGILESPLYYAAKWGGFDDKNKDGKISSKEEWDSYDSRNRKSGADGIPDNYSAIVDPKQLEEDVRRMLQPGSPAAFSYAAIGSISTLDDDSGFNVTTLFREKAKSKDEEINWTGSLTAYSRDADGYLHEDTNQNGKLDSADRIISFTTRTSGDLPETFANFYPSDKPPTAANQIGSGNSIANLNFSSPYWSAEKNLARVKDYVTQADYDHSRANSRYIFTALGKESDTLIKGTSTQMAFDTATFGAASANTRWLDYAPPGNTDNLINYIRGQEFSTFRSRRIDFIDGFSNYNGVTATDNKEPWLLGDIVNSSPLAVGSPKAGYDRDYGDATYGVFREQYKNRRHAVYVGANDGMLHAFNLGKYDTATQQYTPEPSRAPGDELWAYVPFNLLPHLKWLTETPYNHNWYVDGRVKYYDVNIFPSDTTHPNGWGTILVVTMRTGGGAYPIAHSSGPGLDTLRSAVIVMDVTDPDKPPSLIAEIPMPDNTFTTVNPDIVKFRKQEVDGSFSINRWYLALASGVTDLQEFTSDNEPKLFMFDLINKTWVAGSGGAAGKPIPNIKGWVGGINSRDWNGDYLDDYLYFGTVEGTPATPAGSLYRASVDSNGVLGTPTAVLNVTNQAFAATPFTAVDKKGKFWVFAGTGRYYSNSDVSATTNQNSYYAFKEIPSSDGSLATQIQKSGLINLTGVTVDTANQLNKTVTFNNSTIANRSSLEAAMVNASGWYFDFDSANSRNYTSTIMVNNTLVFNTYEPGDECSPFGSARQYQRDFYSGIPRKRVKPGQTVNVLPAFRELGPGAPSDPTPGKKTATGTSLGGIDIDEPEALPVQSGRQSWRELPFSQ